jgi:hypothetical protein
VDALVLEPEEYRVQDHERTEIAQLPLPPGRSYVVFAKGAVSGMGRISVGFELDALDVVDKTWVVAGVRSPDLWEQVDVVQATFALTIATTMPPDPDPPLVARLSTYCSLETNLTGLTILDLTIVALTVDNLSVTRDDPTRTDPRHHRQW